MDDADKESARPDFAVLVYPGHLATDNDNLNPNVPVAGETPPTFLVQAEDDDVDGVHQSLVYYAALKKAGVPVEMHLYAKGGHKPFVVSPRVFGRSQGLSAAADHLACGRCTYTCFVEEMEPRSSSSSFLSSLSMTIACLSITRRGGRIIRQTNDLLRRHPRGLCAVGEVDRLQVFDAFFGDVVADHAVAFGLQLVHVDIHARRSRACGR